MVWEPFEDTDSKWEPFGPESTAAIAEPLDSLVPLPGESGYEAPGVLDSIGGYIQDVKDTISIPGGSTLHSTAQRIGLAEGDPKETQELADISMAELQEGHGGLYNAVIQASAMIGEVAVLGGLGRAAKAAEGLSKARTVGAIGSNAAKRMAASLKSGGMKAILADFGTKVYVESLNRTGDHAFAAKQTAWELAPMMAFQALGLGGMEEWFTGAAGRASKGVLGALGKMASVMAQEVPEELITGYGQAWTSYANKYDENTWKHGKWDLFKETTLVTMLAAGAPVAGSSAANFLLDPSRKNARDAGLPEDATRTKKQREDLAAAATKVADEVVAEVDAEVEKWKQRKGERKKAFIAEPVKEAEDAVLIGKTEAIPTQPEAEVSEEVGQEVRGEGEEAPVQEEVGGRPKLRQQMAEAGVPEDETDAVLAAFDAFAAGMGETTEAMLERLPLDVRRQMVSDIRGVDEELEQRDAGKLWTSPLVDAIDKLSSSRAPVSEAFLLKNGVKAEQLEFSGLKAKLDAGKVTKQEALEWLELNDVRVDEVVAGESPVPENLEGLIAEVEGGYEVVGHEGYGTFDTAEDAWEAMQGTTKFQEYTTPGGENYRELKITLPVANKQKPLLEERASLERERGSIQPYGPSDTKAFDRIRAINQRISEIEKEAYSDEAMDEGFTSSHFDEPNILAHIRFNERTDADGKKVLFIEEIQSDWHQAGQKKGYKKDISEKDRLALRVKRDDAQDRLIQLVKDNEDLGLGTIGDVLRIAGSGGFLDVDLDTKIGRDIAVAASEYRNAHIEFGQYSRDTVPNAPFKTTWHNLAMKRATKWAIDNGFDRVAWTTGEMQADRYDLSKQVRQIEYSPSDGDFSIVMDESDERNDIGGKVVDGVVTEASDSRLEGKPLEDVVGKDVAKRLLEGTADDQGYVVLSGEGLKVGGEYHKQLYDKKFVKDTGKFIKKFGGKVGWTNLEGKVEPDEEGYVTHAIEGGEWVRQEVVTPGPKVHAFDITDKMRDKLAGGVPLFQMGRKPKGLYQRRGNQAMITLFEESDPSTIIHEMFHHWFNLLPSDMMAQARASFGVKGTWTTENKEAFARSGERYLREGKAPTPELQTLFERFKSFLMQVYKSLSASPLPMKLSPEVQGFFDEMFTPQKPTPQPPVTPTQEEVPPDGEEVPLHGEPEGFGTANARTAEVRANVGLDELAGPLSSPMKDRASMFINMAVNQGWEQRGLAEDAANKILVTREPLGELENAGLLVRITTLYEEQRQETSPEEMTRITAELDLLTRATAIAGTTWARMGHARQWLVGGSDTNYELLTFVANAKKRAATATASNPSGTPLTNEERRWFEKKMRIHEKMKKRYKEAIRDWEEKYAERVALDVGKTDSTSKEDLWAKFNDLLNKGCDVNG